MAKRIHKYRYINTKFWNDSYISELDPIEKLLFIYLITNGHTNISGIYEIPLKIMAIETGIDESMFKKIFLRLKDKIRYIDGIVVIKNFIKHQETGSDTVKVGILNCLKDVNINFLKDVISKGYYDLPRDYMDTLYIPYVEGGIYLDSNLDSDSDSLRADTVPIRYSKKPNPMVELFNLFWLEYPKKIAKKFVEPKFMKLTPIMALEIIEDVKNRKSCDDQWIRGYAPHPTTYLNQERWNDDIVKKVTPNSNIGNKGPDVDKGKYDSIVKKI